MSAEQDAGRVIVVGSINADLVATVDRFPGPGETLSGTDFAIEWGGKGANQAAAAAALGAATTMVGAVGGDANGRGAVDALSTVGVDVDSVAEVDSTTGVAVILRDRAGENSIVVVPGANAEVTPALARAALAAIAAGPAVVVTNLEIPTETVEVVAEICAERGWPLVLNPAPARELAPELLSRVTVLTPNETELTLLGYGSVDEILTTGCDAVVVTLGERGARIHRLGADPADVAPVRAEVVDTIGAGDAFTAGLAVGLAQGDTLEAAADRAAAAGALAVEGRGARGGRLSPEAVRARLATR